MSVAAALLAQQPVAFWLAVVAVLAAGAIASGSRAAVASALAAALGAVVAAFAPAAAIAQAAGALAGVATVSALGFARRRRGTISVAPRGRGRAEAPVQNAAHLLGRTARTRAAFVGGAGEVEVDGVPYHARALTPDEFLGADVLVRIVRVNEPALVVRPLLSAVG